MYAEKIKNIITWCSQLFQCAGINQSILEAELLICHTLDVKREKIPLFLDKQLSYREIKNLLATIERRSLHEPIAYIVEEKEFFSIPLYVNQHVLIPRSETELIPEYLLSKKLTEQKILDLCCGSGNISSAINSNNKNINILSTDISSNALKVSAKNSKKNKCGQVTYVRSNMFEGITCEVIDYIISNPPYIPKSDISLLMYDVRQYEPRSALDGGKNGLSYYHIIARNSQRFLLSSLGEVVVEIGQGQADAIIPIFKSTGLHLKKILKDLAGIERILIFGKNK